MTSKHVGRFMWFCIVGSLSTLVDMFLLSVLVEAFSVPVYVAASISFIIASCNGYALNKRFTWKESDAMRASQLFQYVIVSIVGLLLTLLFMYVLIDKAGLHYMLSKAVTVVLVVSWNFTGNSLWTFKERRP